VLKRLWSGAGAYADTDRLRRLASGAERLPHTDRFPLAAPARPSPLPCASQRRRCRAVRRHRHSGLLEGAAPTAGCARGGAGAQVACPGGCADELFCSAACADAAWRVHHALTCCGPPARAPGGGALPDAAPAGSAGAAAAGPGAEARAASGEAPAGARRRGGAGGARAMRRFRDHADATNDVFHVAAQVVAGTLLRAARLLGDARAGGAPPPAAPRGARCPCVGVAAPHLKSA